jgi:acetyl-CoA carboxylase alpha subunit
VSLDAKELQDRLDELKASRASRKTAWQILQELRDILRDHGVNFAPHMLPDTWGISA